MRKLITFFVFFCLLYQPNYAAYLRAELNVKDEHRVNNRDGGFCMWCCLEMLLLACGYEEGKGLTHDRYETRYFVKTSRGFEELPKNGAAKVKDLVSELIRRRIPYEEQYYKDVSIIKKACNANGGAILLLNGWPVTGEGHGILITGYDAESVTFIDPNKAYQPGKENPAPYYTVSWKWVSYYWTGHVVTVRPNQKQVEVISNR